MKNYNIIQLNKLFMNLVGGSGSFSKSHLLDNFYNEFKKLTEDIKGSFLKKLEEQLHSSTRIYITTSNIEHKSNDEERFGDIITYMVSSNKILTENMQELNIDNIKQLQGNQLDDGVPEIAMDKHIPSFPDPLLHISEWERVNNKPDGHCFFYTLLRFLAMNKIKIKDNELPAHYNRNMKHREQKPFDVVKIRQLILNQMKRQDSLPDDIVRAEKGLNLAREGKGCGADAYGGEAEMKAACNLYHIHICVWIAQDDTAASDTQVNPKAKGVWSIYLPRMKQDSSIIWGLGWDFNEEPRYGNKYKPSTGEEGPHNDVVPEKKICYISHTGNSTHFETLIPLQTSNGGSKLNKHTLNRGKIPNMLGKTKKLKRKMTKQKYISKRKITKQKKYKTRKFSRKV